MITTGAFGPHDQQTERTKTETGLRARKLKRVMRITKAAPQMESAMTDAVVYGSSTDSRLRRFADVLGRSLQRAMILRDTHRALDELPDYLLTDIGVERSDIPFVAGVIAFRYVGSSSEAPGRLDGSAERDGAARRFPHVFFVSRLRR